MRFRPIPRDAELFELLTDAAQHLVAGAGLLARLLGADRVRRVALVEDLRTTEAAADAARHAVLGHLGRSFVMPFDRDDVYRLAAAMDDCMDAMEEAGQLVVLHQLGELPDGVTRQVTVLQRCAEATTAAMPRLRTQDGLDEYWLEVNRLENEADDVHRRLLAEILADGADPLHALRLKGVVDALEAGANAFERLAACVETLALKES